MKKKQYFVSIVVLATSMKKVVFSDLSFSKLPRLKKKNREKIFEAEATGRGSEMVLRLTFFYQSSNRVLEKPQFQITVCLVPIVLKAAKMYLLYT